MRLKRGSKAGALPNRVSESRDSNHKIVCFESFWNRFSNPINIMNKNNYFQSHHLIKKSASIVSER
jgi:uncharacterized protein (DUF2235 family)